MSNMSYCRFQNTLTDLWDCLEYINDDYLSKDEERARKQLIEVCRDIIDAVENPEEEYEEDEDE